MQVNVACYDVTMILGNPQAYVFCYIVAHHFWA